MGKFLFVILLLLSIYIYLTVPTQSRAEINHTVVMIPDHMGTVLQNLAEKADGIGK